MERFNASAIDIASVTKHWEVLSPPRVSGETTDCEMVRANIDGHRFKALAIMDESNTGTVLQLLDLESHLLYTLNPVLSFDAYAQSVDDDYDSDEALPTNVS